MVTFKQVTPEKLIPFLEKGKYKEGRIKTEHEQLRYSRGIKNKVLLILFKSGTLLLQGNQEGVEKTRKELTHAGIGKEQKQISFRKELGWVIGSDETLKGDTFGGIIVAAVRADEKIREKLLQLGVADSKTLTDTNIPTLAQEIKKITDNHIVSLLPKEYNRIQKHDGTTKMLNKMHQKVAKQLGAGTHVVDKYPGCTVGDIIETKAEHKYIEVAAASILARAAALEQMEYLSQRAGFPLPKGSTHVKEALKQVQKKGLPFLEFTKLHFKNVQEFL